jgi:hypothetical protein
MTNSQRLAAVRLRLEQWLVENGTTNADDVASETPPKIRGESILIRGGFYCGRQFDAGEHRAIWFMEEDELKISTRDGKWVCSLQGEALVPAEVRPLESIVLKDDEKRDVIAMPLLQKPQRTQSSVESDEQKGSDEQAIRRAA